jgi:ribose 5-phosphate isomerase B
VNLAIGCDEAAFELKEAIKAFVEKKGINVQDFGCFNSDPVLYPDIAVAVAESVVKGENIRGILLCGTGIGMAISANKVPGIRAAVCHDAYSTERSRKSNNAQIMTLGARVVGEELAKYLVSVWLDSEFLGGGSASKVEKIKQYEERYNKEEYRAKDH